MQANHYPGSSSSPTRAGASSWTHDLDLSRVMRPQTHPTTSSSSITQLGWPSRGGLLDDQLTSHELEGYLPYSMVEPASSSQMDSQSQSNGGSSLSSLPSSGATLASRAASGTRPSPDTTANVTVVVPVSSPSLRKILHPANIEIPQKSNMDLRHDDSSTNTSTNSPSSPRSSPPEAAPAEHLAEYTCPICFFPPTNATLTPCGHICCGSCLFTAVKSIMQRGALVRPDLNVARCPVCRAEISGWDGKGGGVIGLRPRAVFSL